MKVLIIGGYGIFGGRLAELLLDEGRLTLFIAGRNLRSAEEFCAAHVGVAKLVAVRMDRMDGADVLNGLKPDLVVDASGPFQAYGEDPYRLVCEALAAGANYVDLADGADFVAQISTLNELAQKSRCFALSGMSSFPVLTAAVVRKLALELDSFDEIVAGIAPSPYAVAGLN